jgi:hypothetical protein
MQRAKEVVVFHCRLTRNVTTKMTLQMATACFATTPAMRLRQTIWLWMVQEYEMWSAERRPIELAVSVVVLLCRIGNDLSSLRFGSQNLLPGTKYVEREISGN